MHSVVGQQACSAHRSCPTTTGPVTEKQVNAEDAETQRAAELLSVDPVEQTVAPSASLETLQSIFARLLSRDRQAVSSSGLGHLLRNLILFYPLLCGPLRLRDLCV